MAKFWNIQKTCGFHHLQMGNIWARNSGPLKETHGTYFAEITQWWFKMNEEPFIGHFENR